MPPSTKSTGDRIIEYGVNFKTNVVILLQQLSNIARSSDSTAIKMEKSFAAINKTVKETGGTIGLLIPALEKAQEEAAHYKTTFKGLDSAGNAKILPQAMNKKFYSAIQPELSVRSRASQELMERERILGIRKQEEEVAASTAKIIEKGISSEEKARQKLAAKGERDALAAQKRAERAALRADKVAKQERLRVIQQPIMIEVDDAKQALKVEAQRTAEKKRYNEWASKYRLGQKGELKIEQQQTAEAKKQTAEITNQANIIKMTIAQKKILAMTKYSDQGQAIAGMGQGQWMEQVNKTKVLLKQLSAEFKVSTGVAANWATGMDIDGEIVRQALKEVRQEAKGLAGTLRTTFGNIQNYISTAFGVSLAMLLFKAQMAVTQFFTDSLQKAKDFRDNMRELEFSEQILSKAGIDVTNEGLLEIAKNIEKLNIGLGKTASIDLVGQIAMAAKTIPGLTSEGIMKLARSAAYIQSIRPDIEAKTIVNAYLDRKDTAINQVVQFSAQDIKNKALELGLIKDTTQELSEQIAYIALQEIFWEQAGSKLVDYSDNIKGTSKEIENLNKQISENLMADFGKSLLEADTTFKSIFVGLAPLLQPILDFASFAIIAYNAMFKSLDEGWQAFWSDLKHTPVDVAREMSTAFANEFILGMQRAFGGSETWLGKKFDPANFGFTSPIVDTPTSPVKPGSSAVDLEEESANKIEQIKIEMLDKGRELDNKRKDEEADNLKERLRAQEDFERDKLRLKEDYEHDLEQAQVDSGNKAAEAQADYQNKELEAELEFQEEMRQLREKFLFDLEDALAQRDARQVIRLQKQYAMDVTNKTNENDLEKQQRARDLAEELVQIANDTQSRIAEIEYNYATEKRRMEEDYLLEQQRREYDHAVTMIRLFRDAGIEMLKLAAELSTLLMQQFTTVISAASQMRSALGGGRAGAMASGGVSGRNTGVGNFIPFAGATASGHIGGVAGGLQQGNLQIQLDVSPNLEATIINNAVNNVAEILVRATEGRR